MTNKSYVKGRAFEYRVRDHFRKQGFLVIRQAKSAFPDLIVITKERPIFVECKVNGYLTPDEKRELGRLSETYKAKACLAYRVGRKLLFKWRTDGWA